MKLMQGHGNGARLESLVISYSVSIVSLANASMAIHKGYHQRQISDGLAPSRNITPNACTPSSKGPPDSILERHHSENVYVPSIPDFEGYQTIYFHNPYGPSQNFHNFTVPSSLPLAQSFPSGLKPKLQIGP